MKIERKHAKEILARKQLEQLNDTDKLEMLVEYWCYDNEVDIREDIKDGRLPKMDEALITLIAATESPTLPLPAGVEVLILDHLLFSLEKVLNSYLEFKLHHFNVHYEVEGQVEKAGMCPCCNFYSIDDGEDGLWDICPVCFWENGGNGPNHMDIEVARKNFLTFGAIDEKALQFIDPEGQIKYARKREM